MPCRPLLQINEQREAIQEIERKLKANPSSMVQRSLAKTDNVSKSNLRLELDEIAEEFLRLEK